MIGDVLEIGQRPCRIVKQAWTANRDDVGMKKAWAVRRYHMRGADADREVETVLASARQAFTERFHRRLVLALEERLRDPDPRATAYATYARNAAERITGPVEVRSLAAAREAVYDAFLAAGVEDFQVVGDPRIHVGFVVRDLDGRTVFDARPTAIVEAHASEIAAWLDEALEPFERPSADGGA